VGGVARVGAKCGETVWVKFLYLGEFARKMFHLVVALEKYCHSYITNELTF